MCLRVLVLLFCPMFWGHNDNHPDSFGEVTHRRSWASDSSPAAAVIHYHKAGGLRVYTFILSQFLVRQNQRGHGPSNGCQLQSISLPCQILEVGWFSLHTTSKLTA